MQLDLESHKSLEAVRGLLAGSRDESVLVPGRKAAYAHIGKVLRRFSYWKLGRADKGLVRRYLERTTGLSRAQLTRLAGRYLAEGEPVDRRQESTHESLHPMLDTLAEMFTPPCERDSDPRRRGRHMVCGPSSMSEKFVMVTSPCGNSATIFSRPPIASM